MLLRRTVVAGSHTSEMLGGLEVHSDRMSAALKAFGDDVLAEQHGLAALAGVGEVDRPENYLGASSAFVDAALQRARDSRP